MKRKLDGDEDKDRPLKKWSQTALSNVEASTRFRAGLFSDHARDKHKAQYDGAIPFKHGVIESLIDDALLRRVREEIRANVSFQAKETDIYRIHQSGDLANLDGLDDSALARLPELLALRDALYSPLFRNYVSTITSSGPLSGRRTDMAINVYTPGCYLLCHDDAIGSRRVSYILYLTDPDEPWRPEWGGALRLYPVADPVNGPDADATTSIPPAWNQLSFFTIQPAVTFHDVEEVFHPSVSSPEPTPQPSQSRVRIAISGWFHIPQIGEDGYDPLAEELLNRNSTLAQLTASSADSGILPAPLHMPVILAPPTELFEAADLKFLLQFIDRKYLSPGLIDSVSEYFLENSSISMSNFLCPPFASRLRYFVEGQAALSIDTPAWKAARPPNKHRFLYQQPVDPNDTRPHGEKSPVTDLLDVLLPSLQFQQWLRLVTKCSIAAHDLTARRFRRGYDYILASPYHGAIRLELNLGYTPTTGWEADGADSESGEDKDGFSDEDLDEGEGEEHEEDGDRNRDSDAAVPSRSGGALLEGSQIKNPDKYGIRTLAKDKRILQTPARQPNEHLEASLTEAALKDNFGGTTRGEGRGTAACDNNCSQSCQPQSEDRDGFGGDEVYMVGEEDATEAKDPAVYHADKSDDEKDDDHILFVQSPAWNHLTLVLRDSSTLRLVKYLNRCAPGDRWDVSGVYSVLSMEQPEGLATDSESTSAGGPALPAH